MKKIILILLILTIGCGKSKREKRKEWIKGKRDSVEVQMKDSIDKKIEIVGQDSIRYIN